MHTLIRKSNKSVVEVWHNGTPGRVRHPDKLRAVLFSQRKGEEGPGWENDDFIIVDATVVDFEPFDPITQTRTGPVFDVGAAPAFDTTATYTVVDKSLANLKTLRKKEADDEADRRLRQDFPTLVDQISGIAKALTQVDGGGSMGGGVLAAINSLDALKGFRDTLKTSINSMNVAQLKALDVTDAKYWQ